MNVGKLRISNLEIAAAALGERSLKRASRELGISQPAVSQAITRVEKELGLSLLSRSGNELVPCDESIISAIEQILSGAQKLQSAIEEQKEQNAALRVGLTSDIVGAILGNRNATSFFSQGFLVTIESPGQLLTKFRSRKLDCIVCTTSPEDNEADFIHEYQMGFFAAKRLKIERQKQEEELEETLILHEEDNFELRKIERHLRDAKIRTGKVLRCKSRDAATKLALLGSGIAVLPEYSVREQVANGLLQKIHNLGSVEGLALGLMYGKDRMSSFGAAQIFEHICLAAGMDYN